LKLPVVALLNLAFVICWSTKNCMKRMVDLPKRYLSPKEWGLKSAADEASKALKLDPVLAWLRVPERIAHVGSNHRRI